MKKPASHFSGETTPYWMNVNIYSPLGERIPLSTDVCVVGAGIAGLTTAYFCAKEGMSVCVLDSGPIAGGQSGRTTAHLTSIMDDRFQYLIRHFGEDKTMRITESHQVAIDQIENIIKTENIDCDFSRLDGYLFLSPDETLEFLERELNASYRVGLQNVELINDFNHSGIGPALKFSHQAQFHPIKYINGIVRILEKLGVTIHPYVRVEEIADSSPCRVTTVSGKVIKCGSVVVATNTPINDRFAIHTKQAPYRTYAIAARIPHGEIPRALYWDTGHPYHYVRLQESYDNDHDVVIVGGEDHKTGQEENPEQRFKNLEAWTKKMFPKVKSVFQKWSGQVWEPVDSLAFIGRNPGEQNVFICTGDSGQGMTYGAIAGMLITDLILGRSNPWEKLYEPSRKPFSSPVQFIKENINVADQYLEYFRSASTESVSEIDRNEGAILQDGINKIAAYRDEKGHIHQFSAVCPHLGGIVHWNKVEKSWDCPCHGSRFNAQGEPITGPANSCLKPWKDFVEDEQTITPITDHDISIGGLTH